MQDCSFLESSQDNYSECTMTDSASLDVVLCDDSPVKSKKNKISKSEKPCRKKESPRKSKEKKKANKERPKVKNKKDLLSKNENSFIKPPITDFKKIKLTSYHLNEEQNSNKASPSSTVNDESVPEKEGKTIFPSEALQFDHKTEDKEKEICKTKSDSFNPESNSLSPSNDSVIKKESEDKIVFSCQESCSDVSTDKFTETLDAIKADNFPNSTQVCQGESVAERKVSNDTALINTCTDNVSKNNHVKMKYESKHDPEVTCGDAACHQDKGVKEFNSNNTANNSFQLLEPINPSNKTEASSSCNQQDKSTHVFENTDNNSKIDHTSPKNKCNRLKENIDHFKTGLNQICEIPLKVTKEADKKSATSDCDLKVEISQNTINLGKNVTVNNSPNSNIEGSKDATRGFSVLSYIPKSASDVHTSKPTQSVNDCQLGSVATPEVIIKSEKETSDSNRIKHKLSVKKEFNCKRDEDELITSSKFNHFLDNEQTHNLNRNSFTNTISNDQVCGQDTCFKQTQKNDINACLLHNILGEDDCLKNCSNECLLKKTTSNKTFSNEDSQSCSMKDLLNSSDAGYVSIANWNESSGSIKKELEFESNKSLNSIFYENKHLPELNPRGRNSSGFQSLSLENCVNTLDYQLNHVSGINIDCDYESEDSNLVIDEDIDPFKEHIEDVLEDQCLAMNCISDSIYPMTNLDTKNNFQEPKPTKEFFDNNFYVKEIDKSSRNVVEKNNVMTVDKDVLRVTENEILKKPAVLSNSIIEEHLQGSLKYNSSTKTNLLPSEENVLQRNSLQCETPHLAAKSYASEKTHSPSKVKENTNLNCRLMNQSSNIKMSPTSIASHLTRPTCLQSSQSENSKLISTNNHPPLVSTINDSSFNQAQQVEFQKHASFISAKEVAPYIGKTSMTRTLQKSQQAEKYAKCNSGNILFNGKSNIPQIGHLQQMTSGVNKFQNLSNVSEDHKNVNLSGLKNENPSLRLVAGDLSSLGSCAQNVQTGSVKYVNNNKLTDSRGYSSKSKSIEVSNDVVFSKSDVILDPLSMNVKTVSEPRELTDFEFNVFPVAHEVEVCSATDAMLGDFVYPGSSEIGHPDWPIANEQSVIDSSNLVSYSSTPDQYLYTPNLSSDQCYALNEMTQNLSINSLELQQVSVDFRYPDNTASYPNTEEFNLHFKTLEVDYNLCCSQRKFKEFYLSQDVPPTIPVPFPPQGRLDNMKSSVRCTCEQCSDNHQKLLRNYNILTQFRNSKVRPINLYSKSVDSSLIDQNCETDCSLPLKKRKTLTNSKSTEEPQLTSYPNTPMISIAQLELTNFEQQNQIVSNNQSHWNEVPSYTTTVLNPLNLAHYSTMQQTDLTRQSKSSKSRTNKRRKSSR